MSVDLKKGTAEWNTDGTRVHLMKNENFLWKKKFGVDFGPKMVFNL